MLKTKDITIKFGGLTAVDSLNLEVNEGETVGLIGPNGAGKTTAFNMITGVYKPTSGSVEFLGETISNLKQNQIAERGISRTFQNIRLFKEMNVLENVLIAGKLRMHSNLFDAMANTPRYRHEEKILHEKAMALLEEMGLADLKDEKATSLPYGKQRKLEIARALATEPKLLLLDEPAAGMNPAETMELVNLINDIKNKYKVSILMIEHHMQLVMNICEKIWVLDYGKEIANGLPEEIQNNERVIQAYLGVE